MGLYDVLEDPLQTLGGWARNVIPGQFGASPRISWADFSSKMFRNNINNSKLNVFE